MIILYYREKTAKIDIGKFSHLKNLKELRLRAACAGLQLPMFAFSLGMSNLSDLTKLRKLVSIPSDLLIVQLYFMQSFKIQNNEVNAQHLSSENYQHFFICVANAEIL